MQRPNVILYLDDHAAIVKHTYMYMLISTKLRF